MARPVVIVTETLDQRPADWLAGRVELIWCSHDKSEELSRHLPKAEGLVVRTYTRVDDVLLAKAPNLKVVGRAGVGLDNIDIPACTARGVRVVSTPDANTQAVVEYVLGLMLDHYRPRPAGPTSAWAPTDFHKLRKTAVGRQLDELTLGMIGFGRIGQRLGRVAATLGIRVIATDVLPRSAFAHVDFPFEFASIHDLCAQSDIVTLHADGRPSNAGMIDGSVMKAMKPDGLFINAARGMLVNNEAIAAWARANSGAGGAVILDVHEPEPPPTDYPLYGIPNVWLLPHLASRTGPALENMSWVVRDVDAVLNGQAPKYPAN